MNKELTNKLWDKYPELFKNKNESIMVSLIPFGFECNDGWYWLIDQLCDNIQSYIDSNSERSMIKNKYASKLMKILKKIKFNKFISRYKLLRTVRDKLLTFEFLNNLEAKFEKHIVKTIPQVVVDQVKEKFGGLRFYYHGGNNMTDGMVWLVENMSYDICETCGSTTNVTQSKGGWITTACHDCRSKK